MVGRAMSDMQRMSGTFQPPELDAEMSVLTGCVSVAAIRGYQTELTAYTKGKGRIFCTLKGYAPCHNAQEVIDSIGYDSERDLENPTGSVFCAHGAGFVVEWDKVNDYMHIDSGWQQPKQEETKEIPAVVKSNTNYGSTWKMDRELEDIFVRTFGPIRQKIGISRNGFGYEKMDGTQIHGAERDGAEINVTENDPMNHWTGSSKSNPVKEYLLVDGYNIIFSWRELNELAKVNMDAARNKLMDILCNYQGFKKMVLILVFDAYKVKGGVGTVMDYHNIHVVYTKEAETADGYIEKTTHEIAREHHVTVATSDALEQLIILGQGAVRLSANDLKEDVDRVMDQIRRDYLDRPVSGRNYLGERFENHMMEHLKGESEKG
jgi:predicted RNA-binding protein with PIN domain